MTIEKAKRPGGQTGANQVLSPRQDTSSLPTPSLSEQDALNQARGALCVVVLTPEGRHRRRLFLTLKSAERARDRALLAGNAARIVLCTLRPERVISSDENLTELDGVTIE